MPLKTFPQFNPDLDKWQSIGPAGLEAGSTYEFTTCSGRVSGIAFGLAADNTTERVYIATANGGVWYTSDRGDNWIPAMDNPDIPNATLHADSQACGAIAVSPHDYKTILLGSGEANRFIVGDGAVAADGLSYDGIGPIRGEPQSDGSIHWITENSSPDLAGHAVYELAWDPLDPDRVLAATTCGIYRREKNGDKFQWTRLESLGTNPDIRVSSVLSVIQNGKTVFYAACWEDGVYTSVDNGDSWQRLSQNFPTTRVCRIGLAAIKSNPKVIYALICNDSDDSRKDAFGFHGIYACDTKTNQWTTLADGNHETLKDMFGTYIRQGEYDLAIAVSGSEQADVERLYVGGSYSGSLETSLFRCKIQLDASNTAKLEEVAYIGKKMHPDMHALAFEPKDYKKPFDIDPQKLWAGNDGGIYTGDPGGAETNTQRLFNKNAGLPTLIMEKMGQHPTDSATLYCGTQDNGGTKYTGKPIWDMVVGGDTGTAIVNWADTSKILWTWPLELDTDGYADLDYYKNQLKYSPAAGVPYNPEHREQANRVAYGTKNIYISKEGEWPLGIADTYFPTKIELPEKNRGMGARLRSLTFANYTCLYAGSMDGRIFRLTEDSSGNWVPVRIDTMGLVGLRRNVPITDIAVDPADTTGNSVFVTLGGQGDYGRVWHYRHAVDSDQNEAGVWRQCSGPNPLEVPDVSIFLELCSSPSDHAISMATMNNELFLVFVSNRVILLARTLNQFEIIYSILPETQTSYEVSLCSFKCNGKPCLFLSYIGSDNLVHVVYSYNGTDWETVDKPVSGSVTTQVAAPMTVYKDKLYISIVSAENNTFMMSVTENGTDWKGPAPVPITMNNTHAYPIDIMVYEGMLCAALYEGHVAYLAVTSLDDPIAWNDRQYSAKSKQWRSGGGYGVMNAYLSTPIKLAGISDLNMIADHENYTVSVNNLYAFFSAESVYLKSKGNQVFAHSTLIPPHWPSYMDDPALVSTSIQTAKRIEVHVQNGEVYFAYVAEDGKVKYSNHVHQYPFSLLNIQHNCIAIDPIPHPGSQHHAMYVGTDVGVFCSIDGGISWRPYSDGMPESAVVDIQIWPPHGPNGQTVEGADEPNRLIRAATYGRSVYQRKL